jgi:hypothetical protein
MRSLGGLVTESFPRISAVNKTYPLLELFLVHGDKPIYDLALDGVSCFLN